MSHQWNSEELLSRWEDRRALQNLMVRFFSQDFLLHREGRMLKTYWSEAEDICVGVNNGYYQGRTAVETYYKALADKIMHDSRLIREKYPERLAALSDEEVYGAGMLDMKALVAPVIEIAGDGATAKGIWTIHGMNTELTESGPVGNWERAYVAADFVRENGAWKVWHLLYVQDLNHPAGSAWNEPAPEYPADPVYADRIDCSFPEPNVRMSVFEKWSPNRPFCPPPAYPERYETFSETFSYGL